MLLYKAVRKKIQEQTQAEAQVQNHNMFLDVQTHNTFDNRN